jgi:hypothetical protein
MSLPRVAGAGFKPEHASDILADPDFDGWFEVHAENYLGAGGLPVRLLADISARWPLSIHGVGLSIGGTARPDPGHLARVKALCDRFEPASFSEHLAWSTHEGVYFGDLLPLPYTRATLERVADHVDEVQAGLGRRLLLENPAAYLDFPETEMGEIEFLTAIARRTGCGLLLDVNNVAVASANRGTSAEAYIDGFPHALVGEIHLAGHAVEPDGLRIDTHDRAVASEVWALFARTVERGGPKPTLIERDADLPPWRVLRAELAAADRILAPASALAS